MPSPDSAEHKIGLFSSVLPIPQRMELSAIFKLKAAELELDALSMIRRDDFPRARSMTLAADELRKLMEQIDAWIPATGT